MSETGTPSYDQSELSELRHKLAEGLVAMVALGKHFLLRDSDSGSAAIHFEAAALFKHPEAMLFLAQMHLQGDVVEPSNERAVEMLIELAWKGVGPATELLKTLWAKQICRDQIGAFHREVYERSVAAAEEENDEAMVQAAIMLMTLLVEGDEPSPEAIGKARQLLMKAALFGNDNAAMLLQQFPPLEE